MKEKNIFIKSAIVIMSCLGVFAQAEDISQKTSVEIDLEYAPSKLVFAAENDSIENFLKKHKTKKEKLGTKGKVYQVDLMNSDEVVAPYSAFISEPVFENIETSVAYSEPVNKVATVMTRAATMATFTPLCTTLSTGTLYTINGATTGGAYCYHFNVSEKSKTRVLLLNIASSNDMRLTLYRHEADDSLTTLGESNNAGNANEEIIALTEPGNYYWYMEAINADGSPFSFASILNTAIDNYEMNDTPSLSTALPDRFNQVIGNMDSTTDIDYYNFTALRGQDLRFLLNAEGAGTTDEWLFDYFDGSTWQRLGSGGNDYVLNGVPVGYVLNVRVLPNPAFTVNSNNNYKLSIGSTVRKITSSSVEGESTVLRVPYSATVQTNYLTTQAYNKLNWSVRLADSTGASLEGEVVNLNYWLGNESNKVKLSGVTNSSGFASGIVDLGTCYGNYTSGEHSAYNNDIKSWWITNYNLGGWYVRVPNAFLEDDLGIGAEPYVSIGHLCTQTFLRSEY